jgi:hypothetical protein
VQQIRVYPATGVGNETYKYVRAGASGTGSGDDWTNRDFSLDADTDAGTVLGAPYNIDWNGVTATTPSRGALEY